MIKDLCGINIQHYNIFLRDNTIDSDILCGFFEGDEGLAYNVFDLPEVATVLDVGAHIGLYTMRILKDRPDLNVITMEPEPDNYWLMCNNFIINNLKVKCLPTALTHIDGIFQLNEYFNSGSWGILDRSVHGSNSLNNIDVVGMCMNTVKTTTGVNTIDYIKMDIEGYETIIVPMFPDWVWDTFIGMDIELHYQQPDDPTKPSFLFTESMKMINFIKDKGFTTRIVHNNHLEVCR